MLTFRSPVARRRALLACAVGLGVLGLWLVLLNTGPRDPSGPRAMVGRPAGANRPAPDFSRPLLLDHGTFRLSSNLGQVTVVNFWASWCTACRSETPELDQLWRTYRARGVRFVGIDYEDHREAAIRFARSLHLGYPIVADADGKVGDAFGIVGLPTTFIVAPDGRIRYVVSGKLRLAPFTAALASLVTGSPSPAG